MKIIEAASRIRLMGFDVDGVMTDGRLYFTPSGETIKVFSTLDGHGIKMLQQAGIQVAIISGRASDALRLRATDLGITELHMGIKDKRACLDHLLSHLHLTHEQAGYMGDDIIDLPILRACGFAAAPANCHEFVRNHVHVVTTGSGGQGAVREICDLILKAQNKLEVLLAQYLN